MGELAGEKDRTRRGIKVELKKIYRPISEELTRVEHELERQIRSEVGFTNEIVTYFFKVPGKRLRPALVLLSAKAVNDHPTSQALDRLLLFAAAVELIHSASLIHDDLIDGSVYRRRQLTLNRRFGNHEAVLIGDALYCRAFSILSANLPREISIAISQTTEKMCAAEIEQSKNIHAQPTRERYLEIIRDKTALFMSICCRFGADLGGGSKTDIATLERSGLNFGMAYQLMDDYHDALKDLKLRNEQRNRGKESQVKEDLAALAKFYTEEAKKAIRKLYPSDLQNSLSQLADLIVHPTGWEQEGTRHIESLTTLSPDI